jgi:hypothetical protein
MGTDWMNLTVEPTLDTPDKYLASASPPSSDEIVRNKLKECGDFVDFADAALPTIKMRQKQDLDAFVKQISDKMPCNRILAIMISDSTHTGGGILFNVKDNGYIERIEKWSGYSGAKGADVRGYFKEEHNIAGSYEYIWD